MDEIDRVDSSEKNKEDASVSYTTHEDYYLDSNYTLWVNMGNTSPKTTYQMVVILPQNIGTDWNSTDLYVQANTLLNFVYSMRYTALVTMFVSFIIGAAAFVFLMCAAGHRNGTDEIVTTVWDHLWLDVFAVGAVLAEVFVSAERRSIQLDLLPSMYSNLSISLSKYLILIVSIFFILHIF